jgi:hypothetical protein
MDEGVLADLANGYGAPVNLAIQKPYWAVATCNSRAYTLTIARQITGSLRCIDLASGILKLHLRGENR